MAMLLSAAGTAQAQSTITPVYQPVFDPSSVTVVVGERETVKLSLPGVPDGVRVTVNVGFTSGAANAEIVAGGGNLRFDPDDSYNVTILGVAAGNARVQGRVIGIRPPDSDIPDHARPLQITVIPAPLHLALAFDPTSLTLVGGSEVEVRLHLLGDVPVGVVAPVEVNSADETVAREMTRAALPELFPTVLFVTVEGRAEGRTTVSAIALTDFFTGLPPDSTVESAHLPVTVVPAPVHLRLAFDPTSLTVVVGSVGGVTVSLLGDVPEGGTVSVGLGSEDPQVARWLSVELPYSQSETVLSAVLLMGEAAGRTVLKTVHANLFDFPEGSTVELAELSVTVVLPPVHLTLAFDPTSLEIVAGESETVMLSLSGLSEDDLFSVTVAVSTSDEETVRPVTPNMAFLCGFSFFQTTCPVPIASGINAGEATLTAFVRENDFRLDLPPNSTVAPAELPVTVVPPPARLQLSFDPSTLTVVAGAQGTAQLRLVGDVPEGAAGRVELSATDGEATVLVMPESVVLGAATTSREVTVEGVVAGTTTVTAIFVDDPTDSGLPPNSTVALAQLAVTVVPVPVELQLSFDSLALTVAAGAERTAVLSLPGVPTGAAVTVALSATNTAIAEVMPESVTFIADMRSSVVTVTGVAVGNATVTAVLDVSSGLPPNSIVASTELVVTVVPTPLDPVTLTLAFDPMSLTVTAGREATAVLSLPNVPEGVEVAVTLSAADATTARVLSEPVVFSAGTTRHEVTIEGVVAGDVTVTAVADTSGLPVGSTVMDAQLQVTVKTPGLRLRVRALLEGPLQ